jgi:hypothetical protein
MSVITDSIKATLRIWREAFLKRWAMQPPEFFLWGGLHNEDLYSRDIGDMTNPLRTEWFPQLVREATLADLDAIERNLGGESVSCRGYQRFFQAELLRAAKKEHDEGRPYSEEIPTWFRFKDWNIGPKWKCEERRDKALWMPVARSVAAAELEASLEATMPAGHPTLSAEKTSVAGHPLLAAMRREDAAAAAPAAAAGGAGAGSETAWERTYAEHRERLRAAREAVREAEALLDAHMFMRR